MSPFEPTPHPIFPAEWTEQQIDARQVAPERRRDRSDDAYYTRAKRLRGHFRRLPRGRRRV